VKTKSVRLPFEKECVIIMEYVVLLNFNRSVLMFMDSYLRPMGAAT